MAVTVSGLAKGPRCRAEQQCSRSIRGCCLRSALCERFHPHDKSHRDRLPNTCLSNQDKAVQAPSFRRRANDCARVHRKGRDPARDHLAREILPLEDSQAPANRKPWRTKVQTNFHCI